MDSRSPQPPAAPPSSPKTNDKRGCMIAAVAGIVGLLLLIGIGAATMQVIPLLNPSSDTAMAEKLEQAPKLTESMKPELMSFAEALVKDILQGDLEATNAKSDFEALATRVFHDMQLTGLNGIQMRQGFLQGIQKRGFFGEITGSAVRPLRIIERDGLPAVTLRILPATGGVNYVDALIWKSEDGFKVIDVFTYLYGSLASKDSRNILAAMLPDGNGAAFAQILGASGDNLKEVSSAIKLLSEKGAVGDFEGVIQEYRQLSPAVQQLHLPFVRYLTALQELSAASENEDHDAAYREAIQKAPKVFGTDATTNLLLIDDYLIEGDFDKAIETTHLVDEAVGGDPYLHVMRGWIHYQQGEMADVARCLALIDQEEPGMPETVDLKLSFLARTKDFKALVRELKDFQIQFGNRITRADLAEEPQYEAFLESPEFAAYEKQGE